MFVDMMKKFKELAIDYKLLIKKLLEKIEEEAINSKKDSEYSGLEYSLLKEMAYELAGISNYVNINIDPYLLIEVSLLKYFTNNKQIVGKSDEKSWEITENTDKIISREIISKEKSGIKPLEDDNKLVKIRVNNCFVNAKKEYLQEIKLKWPEFISKLTDNSLLNLLIDCEVVAASDSVAILTNVIDATVKLINKNIEKIGNNYSDIYGKEYKFIALTELEWKKEKEIYISNLKNKIEYKYIEEPEIEEVIEEEPSIEQAAFDIFDKDKIEIE